MLLQQVAVPPARLTQMISMANFSQYRQFQCEKAYWLCCLESAVQSWFPIHNGSHCPASWTSATCGKSSRTFSA